MRISDWSSDVCPSDLPTKRYDRHLAEEGRDAGIDIVRAEQSKQDADRREPEDKQGAGYLERPAKIRPGMVGTTFAQSRIAVMPDVTARRTVAAAALASRQAEQNGRAQRMERVGQAV